MLGTRWSDWETPSSFLVDGEYYVPVRFLKKKLDVDCESIKNACKLTNIPLVRPYDMHNIPCVNKKDLPNVIHCLKVRFKKKVNDFI